MNNEPEKTSVIGDASRRRAALAEMAGAVQRPVVAGGRAESAPDCPRTAFEDPHTGRTVWRVAAWPGQRCLATYMYHQAMACNDRYLCFASDRTGTFESYRLELATGRVVRLTSRRFPSVDDPFHDVATTVHPNDRELLYRDGTRLMAVDVERGTTRLFTTARNGWRTISLGSLACGGERVACSFTDGEGRVGIAVAEAGGALKPVYRAPEGARVSHVLCVPGEGGRIVSFNPLPDAQEDSARPDAERARTCCLDTQTGRTWPLLVMPLGQRATHEYWARDADGQVRLFYHRKTVPTWTPAAVESIDVSGGDRRVDYESAERPLGHSCLSPDGRTIVSDVQEQGRNELIRIDVSTGQGEVLCWPNASNAGGNMTHVHPSFSRSGRHLVYTSDAGGTNAVYVLRVDG